MKKLNRNIVLLLFGRMISDLGSSIQAIVMPLYIIDIGGSAITVGLFSFFTLIPILLCYPIAGVLSDRYNRKLIMVSCDILSGTLLLLLASVSFSQRMNLVILAIVQMLVSVFYSLFDTATKGIIPLLINTENLPKTNSYVVSIRTFSALIAPLIAVLFYQNFGISLLFLLNGISFLLSALSESFIEYYHTVKTMKKSASGIVVDMKDGISFIHSNEEICNFCFYMLFIYMMIFPIISVGLPFLFRTELSYSNNKYGVLQTILAFGALSGSFAIGILGKKYSINELLKFGVFSMTISLLLFSFIVNRNVIGWFHSGTLYFIIMSLILFLIYASILSINITIQTKMQEQISKDYMSRVFSIVGLITKGGMPFGVLLFGWILSLLEMQVTVFVIAVAILILSAYFLKRLKENT